MTDKLSKQSTNETDAVLLEGVGTFQTPHSYVPSVVNQNKIYGKLSCNSVDSMVINLTGYNTEYISFSGLDRKQQ